MHEAPNLFEISRIPTYLPTYLVFLGTHILASNMDPGILVGEHLNFIMLHYIYMHFNVSAQCANTYLRLRNRTVPIYAI